MSDEVVEQPVEIIGEPAETNGNGKLFGKRKFWIIVSLMIFSVLLIVAPALYSWFNVPPEIITASLPVIELIGKGIVLVGVLVFFGLNMMKK